MNRKLSPATIRSYRGGWKRFRQWLASEYPGADPFEADADTVAAFVVDLVHGATLSDGTELKPSTPATAVQRIVAINHYRRERGLPPFKRGEGTIAEALHTVRRAAPPTKQAKALRRTDLETICDMLEHRTRCGRVDRRNRAGNILYTDWPHEPDARCRFRNPTPDAVSSALAMKAYVRVSFGALLRVSECVALRWRDVKPHPEEKGWGEVHIRRSKTDQYGEGAVRSVEPEVMDALRAWKRRSRTARPKDYVFPWRRPGNYTRRLKLAARDAGLADPEGYSSHSLRIGRAVELAAAGASVFEIMSAGRWKDPAIAERYCQQADRARADAALRRL
ncbi:MAG: tyrosine-type recombinase/integrase [Gemmatimonadetes bacterium]|nr:tyrosine-type recombinase/integrase [Candidatus Palauibacter rhopaloidicola]